MSRRKQQVQEPNYKILYQTHISRLKTTYDNYRNAMIKFYANTGISLEDGGFIYYGSLCDKVAETRKEYEKAVKEFETFKTLYGDKINEEKLQK